mmetsp:Transcript_26739/g.68541  ORF Transcript_26739/g.68541 Transcript_26739/m.68541 type:complete len:380 (-) Transcript_26739:24-1163(-)
MGRPAGLLVRPRTGPQAHLEPLPRLEGARLSGPTQHTTAQALLGAVQRWVVRIWAHSPFRPPSDPGLLQASQLHCWPRSHGRVPPIQRQPGCLRAEARIVVPRPGGLARKGGIEGRGRLVIVKAAAAPPLRARAWPSFALAAAAAHPGLRLLLSLGRPGPLRVARRRRPCPQCRIDGPLKVLGRRGAGLSRRGGAERVQPQSQPPAAQRSVCRRLRRRLARSLRPQEVCVAEERQPRRAHLGTPDAHNGRFAFLALHRDNQEIAPGCDLKELGIWLRETRKYKNRPIIGPKLANGATRCSNCRIVFGRLCLDLTNLARLGARTGLTYAASLSNSGVRGSESRDEVIQVIFYLQQEVPWPNQVELGDMVRSRHERPKANR